MEEKKNRNTAPEIKDEQLDAVAGGFYCDPGDKSCCPNCGQWNEPVWSVRRNMFICPNPDCQVQRASRKPVVQTVI